MCQAHTAADVHRRQPLISLHAQGVAAQLVLQRFGQRRRCAAAGDVELAVVKALVLMAPGEIVPTAQRLGVELLCHSSEDVTCEASTKEKAFKDIDLGPLLMKSLTEVHSSPPARLGREGSSEQVLSHISSYKCKIRKFIPKS